MTAQTITINGIALNKTKLLVFIYEDKKIQAIKYIKDATNLDLRESKEIVDL